MTESAAPRCLKFLSVSPEGLPKDKGESSRGGRAQDGFWGSRASADFALCWFIFRIFSLLWLIFAIFWRVLSHLAFFSQFFVILDRFFQFFGGFWEGFWVVCSMFFGKFVKNAKFVKYSILPRKNHGFLYVELLKNNKKSSNNP